MSDGGKGNAIMIAIGKAKKKPGFLGGDAGHDEPDADDAGDSGGHSDDELEAMKAFEEAGSPEEKLSALKTIIKLCTEEDY